MPRKTRLNEADMQKEISKSVKSLMDFTKTNTVNNLNSKSLTMKTIEILENIDISLSGN